jgi:SAM-dependent methyltransferase
MLRVENIVVATIVVSILGCRDEQSSGPAGPSAPSPQATDAEASSDTQATAAAPPHTPSSPQAAHVPPLDCPLHNAEHAGAPGASHSRPFADINDYIKFLERDDRASWQRPDEVIAALALAPDATVLELGAGSGYFAFRFAAAVPNGQVLAGDVEPDMVRHMHHRAMTSDIRNLRAILVDPSVPAFDGADIDLVFICDVLHHVPSPDAWLQHIVSRMPQGARLALVEFSMGDIPHGPPVAMRIPKERLLSLATTAGLVLVQDFADLLPYQEFLVFRKP